MYADLTARENLDYFARIVGAPAGAGGRGPAHVDLSRLSRRQVRSVSGGEWSRVSLAAALLATRSCSSSTSRPSGSIRCSGAISGRRSGLAEAGTTLLVSSHVMDEAERCDELVLIRDGRIVAQSEPEELLRRNGRDRPRGGVPDADRGARSRRDAATAVRVLRQLRRDPRTLALLFAVPPLLLTLFKYVFDGQPETFDRIGGPLVGIFPFVLMFVITSITMLRERTTGTLERLMTLPISKLDVLLGYGLAFALVAAVQARSPLRSLSACSGSTSKDRWSWSCCSRC